MNFYSKIKLVIAGLLITVNTSNAQEGRGVGRDVAMPRWFVGAGVFGGIQTLSINQTNWNQSYLNAVNANIPSLEKEGGRNLGFNVNLGYFFGSKRNIGLGTGIQYLNLKNTLGLHHMAIEYQSIDNFGSTFRQGLRANGQINEQIKQSVWGLPILLLYKKQLNNKWGVNVDAGVIINLANKATYEAENASFDYEAIYAFDGNGNPVYDNAPTPDPNDWLITKAHYEKVNNDGNVNGYFENLYNQGYNVGLGVKPQSSSGDVKNSNIATSWFISPSVSYRIKPNLALHGAITYQQVKTTFDAKTNYMITDKRGSYESMSNGVNSLSNGLLNIGLGIRYYFGKERVAKPTPPPPPPAAVVEPKKEDPYKEMVKVTVQLQDEQYGKPVPGNIVIKKGETVVYNGKADDSGISNFYLEPGEYTVGVTAKGYIPAEESLELNPSEKGKSKVISLKQPKIEKGLVFKLKAINFETGSDQMKQSSYDILNKMADILKENPNMVIEVAGHTDNVGDDQKNLLLSENRAKSVMNYLLTKGVEAKQLKAVGYGETKPIASNETEEGRLANRRVMFTVLEY